MNVMEKNLIFVFRHYGLLRLLNVDDLRSSSIVL